MPQRSRRPVPMSDESRALGDDNFDNDTGLTGRGCGFLVACCNGSCVKMGRSDQRIAFRVVGTFRRRPRLHGLCHAPSGPQPTSTIMCASPGIARATCAPDSHHLQLSAVLVHALGSFAASPHAQAMAMQFSRARGTQWHVGSAANALARTTLTR